MNMIVQASTANTLITTEGTASAQSTAAMSSSPFARMLTMIVGSNASQREANGEGQTMLVAGSTATTEADHPLLALFGSESDEWQAFEQFVQSLAQLLNDEQNVNGEIKEMSENDRALMTVFAQADMQLWVSQLISVLQQAQGEGQLPPQAQFSSSHYSSQQVIEWMQMLSGLAKQQAQGAEVITNKQLRNDMDDLIKSLQRILPNLRLADDSGQQLNKRHQALHHESSVQSPRSPLIHVLAASAGQVNQMQQSHLQAVVPNGTSQQMASAHMTQPWLSGAFANAMNQASMTTAAVASPESVKVDNPIGKQTKDQVPFQSIAPTSFDKAVPFEQMKVNAPIPVQSDQWVKQMSELVLKQLSFGKVDGMSTAKMTLSPEHLGQLAVKLTMQNGQLVAQFVASTAMGKELIETQIAQLRIALQNQGLQVNRIEVSQNMGDSTFLMDAREQQSQRQYAQSSSSRANRYAVDDEFMDVLDESTAKPHSMRAGSSFEASA